MGSMGGFPGGLSSPAVRDVILYRALRLAQVTGGPGRSPSPDQCHDALIALNGLIETLNIQRAAIYGVTQAQYTLTAPLKQVYTIGRDPIGVQVADFDAPAPTRIEQARLVLASSPTPTYLALNLVNPAQWAALGVRNISSTIPTDLYCDYGYPLSSLHFWPAPTQVNDLELWTWQQVSQFESIDDPVVMPPGYADMYVYQLAVRMSEQFGTQISPNVMSTANKLLGRIKAFNDPSEPIPSTDWGTGSNGGGFNYLTGMPT